MNFSIKKWSSPKADMASRFGPSLEHQHRRFQEVFASERDLVKMTNRLLKMKADIEAEGGYVTEVQYGERVRHEAIDLLGRAVVIGR